MSDSQLANDRTFLAWLRTGIAMYGFGFVVAKVALIVDSGSGGVRDDVLYTSVGTLMVLGGAALVAFGYVLHSRVARELAPEQSPPRWPRTIARVAVVGAVLLSALIIITT